MPNLTPASSFDDVPELEITTQALGGPGGPMNAPLQALLNRTKWLLDNTVGTIAGLGGSPSAAALKAALSLNLVANTADASKSVASAAALTTSRNIDGQAFNGTADITVVAPATHAATSKTTPVDADELSLVDSASGNVLAKLTWANLKATLKAYFDTLYRPASYSVQTVVSAATVTPLATNDKVIISAQGANLTIADPSGTPAEGMGFVIALKDDGTSRTITMGPSYRAMGAALTTATVSGKWLYIPVQWNGTDSKWDVFVASQQG